MTDETVKIENCRVAMKAALEAIQDYCGTEPAEAEDTFGEAPDRIEILGELIMISEPIRLIAEDLKLTKQERIDAIKESWEGRGTAKQLCPALMKPGETEDGCIDRIVTLIADKMVYETIGLQE